MLIKNTIINTFMLY